MKMAFNVIVSLVAMILAGCSAYDDFNATPTLLPTLTAMPTRKPTRKPTATTTPTVDPEIEALKQQLIQLCMDPGACLTAIRDIGGVKFNLDKSLEIWGAS
jgi:hypothetical protein